MHIVHLIRRRFPTRYKAILVTLILLSSLALLLGVGIILATGQ